MSAAGGEHEQKAIERDIHRLIVLRDNKYTNFIEYSFKSANNPTSGNAGKETNNFKVVYRRYAGLFFTLCIDQDDNELIALEIIHLFVQLLDQYFSNVCELDLVFNFGKVYNILDEYILSGEVMEPSLPAILSRIKDMEKLD